jgi:hypothetical protein
MNKKFSYGATIHPFGSNENYLLSTIKGKHRHLRSAWTSFLNPTHEKEPNPVA